MANSLKPGSTSLHYEETAVPTLKVMRLQSPELDQVRFVFSVCALVINVAQRLTRVRLFRSPLQDHWKANAFLDRRLRCPIPLEVSRQSQDERCRSDATSNRACSLFGTVIHVGESFTAYLGAVNVSQNLMVRRLTVTAQLQTPSQRWPLPSSLDANLGVDVRPGDGVDAIVSKALEESGQHILRVEVGYQTTEGAQKTLRKFYRFNVSNPLAISEKTVRSGDNACFVSIGVENTSQHPMVITAAKIECQPGLVATQIGGTSPTKVDGTSATQLFDSCGLLEPKASFRYLFQINTTEAYNRGIACGDGLGRAVFEWNKTMGETGRFASGPISCPMVQPPGLADKNPTKLMMGTGNDFVVQGTGLSVDVAKVAASRAAGKPTGNLDELLPITVEPLEPPSTMTLATPQEVKFLIVNHSTKAMDLQLQFRLNHMSGVAVCGKSFKNLGEVPPNGGSVVETMRILPLVGGLLRVQGCCIVDLTSGKEVPQPPLFNVFVDPTMVEQ